MKHPARTYWRYFRILQKQGSRQKIRQKTLLEEHHCLNCGMTYIGNFCPNCGQTAKTERFTVKETLRQLLFFFTKFDDKFKNTVVELCYRPGYMIRDYIKGHRVNYMRPLQMLVCLVTVYALITYCFLPAEEPSHFISVERDGVDVVQQYLVDHPFLAFCHRMIEAAMNNRIVSTVFLLVFMTLPSWISFRRKKQDCNYNIAEHFYALTYVACMTMILNFIVLPYNLFVGNMSHGAVFDVIIVWWVYCQLFSLKRRNALIRLLLMLMLTLIEVIIICVTIACILAMMGVIDITK